MSYLKPYKGYVQNGKCFHKGFAGTLCIEGFMPCKADSDIWMRCNNDIYEYIAVYVDSLWCAMKKFLDCFIKVQKYKLKGDKPLSYHLGSDFSCKPDGTCHCQPKKYISKILSSYEHMIPGETLKKQSSPVLKGDHPELDNLELISKEEK